MNYPSINEYKEAILFAEDNFEQLKNLRPVLEDDGSPVMTSGNFAVVFKMKDEQTGKLHAVKCFLREQEGRAEAYRMIAEELEYVSSTFLTPIKYLDKELFVDTNAGDEKEFPVLLMDWVEGETLDKYIRKHLDDQYELSLLAYQFSRLAMWLMPQPFAHGDLKPDNILVKSDGTLVLVDYDGMYVPAMKGQKARELGSPDFRHPSRTETDFDEHIDDFSLASILLSLKAISLQPSLLEEYGAQDRLLFSEKDYRNLSESRVMDALKPLMQDAELASLYSLFILAASQNNLSGVSFRLFYLNRPNVSSPKKSMRVLQINKKIVNQSDKKIIKKELLASFQGKKNVTHIIASNGTSSYLTQERSFSDETFAKGACKLNTVENDTKHVLFLFNERDAEVGRYYLGKKLQGLTPKHLTEIKHELCFFESWNPETKTWVPCVGKAKEKDEDKEYVEKYGKTKSEYLKENFNEVNTLTAVCLKKVFDFYHHYDYPELEVGKTYKVTHIGVFRFFTRIMLSGFGNKEYNSVCFEIFENGESINKKYARDPRFEAPYLREKYHPGLSSNDSIEEENLSTEVTEEDWANAWTDEFGVTYSADRKRLLKAPEDILDYTILNNTKIICDNAFNGCNIYTINLSNSITTIGKNCFLDCHNLSSIIIPNSVTTIKENAFYYCSCLYSIFIPSKVANIEIGAFACTQSLTSIVVDESNQVYDSRNNCNAIIETKTNTLIAGCSASIIPNNIDKIGNRAFLGCENLSSIIIPNSVEIIGDGAFWCCAGLTSVTIPDSVTRIEDFAFFSCIDLSEITFLGNIVTIGDEVLDGCPITNLYILKDMKMYYEKLLPDYKDLFIEKEEDEFYSTDVTKEDIDNAWIDDLGVMYSCDKKRLLKAPKDLKDYTIKDGTIVICDGYYRDISYSYWNIELSRKSSGAFWECGHLNSIVIPNSVKKIGHDAFYGCKSLKNIDLSDSLRSIGYNAFSNCWTLTQVEMPNSLVKVGDDLFYNCKNLNKIIIPKGSKNKFEGFLPADRDKLVEKEIDENLSSVFTDQDLANAWTDEYGAKYSADRKRLLTTPIDLTNYKIRGGTIVICNKAFNNHPVLYNVTIPYTVTSIGYRAFWGCGNLAKIELPAYLKFIGNQAFDGCAQLNQIIIPIGTSQKYEVILADYKDKLIEIDNGWRIKDTRGFTADEIAAVVLAKVVPSQYGLSVCFDIVIEGQTINKYIPLSNKSNLVVDDVVDLKTAKLITLCREGDDDIYRVME